MADIFISYARENREVAATLANALEAQGWSVWWDTRLSGGEAFDEVIEAELDKAKCVIVLWSEASVKSRWVKTEAMEGLEREVLCPMLIENIKPPLAFRLIHTTSLVDYLENGDELSSPLLLRDLSRVLGPPPNFETDSIGLSLKKWSLEKALPYAKQDFYGITKIIHKRV